MAVALYFPEMFRIHIEDKIKLPKNMEDYDIEEYPQFYVFLKLHLGILYALESIAINAEIIGDLTNEGVKRIDLEGLVNKGLAIPSSRLD